MGSYIEAGKMYISDTINTVKVCESPKSRRILLRFGCRLDTAFVGLITFV
jgi:hypothetical protein